MTYKKKAITIIASIESYKNLATFDNIDDLNNTVRKHKEMHKLNKNQLRVLNLLHNYSAKYKGVSFLTKNNIAKKLEISRRTVIRVCQKLESLNIIKQYATKRKTDMQQTSNAIVIQPIVTEDNAKNDEDCHSKKTTTDLKQNNNKRVRNTHTHATTLDYTHVSSNIPKKLVDSITPFFYKADDIYSIYKRLKMATKQATDTLHTNLDDYISTFKQTLYRWKNGHIKGDYLGYLYGAFSNTCNNIVMQQNAKKGLFYDWLGMV